MPPLGRHTLLAPYHAAVTDYTRVPLKHGSLTVQIADIAVLYGERNLYQSTVAMPRLTYQEVLFVHIPVYSLPALAWSL